MEGARRVIGKPPSQEKDLINTDIAKTVLETFRQDTNLVHQRMVIICLLAFSSFLRISELVNIQVKHLTFTNNHLEIIIPKSKMDQQRQGHILHMNRSDSPYCLVQWLTIYLNRTDLIKDSENFIISRLAKTGTGHNAHGEKQLAKSTVREIFHRDITPICNTIEPGPYSPHSLRSGGASAASNNGVSDRLVGEPRQVEVGLHPR